MDHAIRLATEDDAGAVAAIYAPVVRGSATSFEAEPPTESAMADRIAGTLERFPWLVAERDGSVVGYAYAGAYRKRAAYRWSVEVSVYVAEGARRGGVGRGLYESLLATLRLQGFVNAYAVIVLPNPASVGLHESVGFERFAVFEDVGYKRGAWRDVGWWRASLADPESDPDPPHALATQRGSSELDAAISAGEGSLGD